jgi:hypothetical protein
MESVTPSLATSHQAGSMGGWPGEGSGDFDPDGDARAAGHEQLPELRVILKESFLQDEAGRW